MHVECSRIDTCLIKVHPYHLVDCLCCGFLGDKYRGQVCAISCAIPPKGHSITRHLLVQDTAAQVAAMTAELNQMADQMLPDVSTGNERHIQRGKENKSLRQRLVDSWDGKVSASGAWLRFCNTKVACMVLLL